MRRPRIVQGYALIEVIVAILVFSVGALALVASSALVVRGMASNSLREEGARVGANRVEVIRSECAIATSGRESIGRIESDWVVTNELAGPRLVESVHCRAMAIQCVATYRANVWCRR